MDCLRYQYYAIMPVMALVKKALAILLVIVVIVDSLMSEGVICMFIHLSKNKTTYKLHSI